MEEGGRAAMQHVQATLYATIEPQAVLSKNLAQSVIVITFGCPIHSKNQQRFLGAVT